MKAGLVGCGSRGTTWEEMMNSGMRMGPSVYQMGPVEVPLVPPVPGTPTA